MKMTDNKRKDEGDNDVLEAEAKKPRLSETKQKKETENGDHCEKDNEISASDNARDEECEKNCDETEQNGNHGAEHDYEHESTVTNEQAALTPDKKTEEISGELLFSGATNWDLIGRRKVPKDAKNIGPNLWGPHRIEATKGMEITQIFSGPAACHSVVLNAQGEPLTWGRNEAGQLGHGDTKRRDNPLLVECLRGLCIVSAACGRNHTLLLSDTGRVFSMGENKMGQLGLGNTTPTIPSPTQITHSGPPICRIAAGSDFSVIVDIMGNLYSFGCPEYGQLGHNSDGKYFITSNKQTFNYETSPRRVAVYVEKTRDGRVNPIIDVEVKEVACGPNHTVIIDQKKRVFTWGFGGYGRLGHNEPKDEMVPRQIKLLDSRNIISVACGSSFTMACTDSGVLFYWGLNKPTGEATMYPKPVQDLSGWKVRSMSACFRSIVVAADDSVVSWGPSPTYGELAYGDGKSKSSTVPQEVKTLQNIFVHRVACGYGHTLMLARNDSDIDRKRLDELPVHK